MTVYFLKQENKKENKLWKVNDKWGGRGMN